MRGNVTPMYPRSWLKLPPSSYLLKVQIENWDVLRELRLVNGGSYLHGFLGCVVCLHLCKWELNPPEVWLPQKPCFQESPSKTLLMQQVGRPCTHLYSFSAWTCGSQVLSSWVVPIDTIDTKDTCGNVILCCGLEIVLLCCGHTIWSRGLEMLFWGNNIFFLVVTNSCLGKDICFLWPWF